MRTVTRALLVIAAGCGGPRAPEQHPAVAHMPPELAPSYELFARRCSKCHSLSRPLDSGIDDDKEWQTYVERMRLMPGSGISPEDAEAILPFLRHYAAEERRRKRGGGEP